MDLQLLLIGSGYRPYGRSVRGLTLWPSTGGRSAAKVWGTDGPAVATRHSLVILSCLLWRAAPAPRWPHHVAISVVQTCNNMTTRFPIYPQGSEAGHRVEPKVLPQREPVRTGRLGREVLLDCRGLVIPGETGRRLGVSKQTGGT